MSNKHGGSRENAGRKRTENRRVFLTVSPETENALIEFKKRWQSKFPKKNKTGYVAEIDARLKFILTNDAIELSNILNNKI